MSISEYLQVGGFAITSIGAIVVVLTYRRTKRQELENQLNRVKLDSLANSTYYVEQYLLQMESTIYYLKKLAQAKDKFDRKRAQELEVGLEKATYEAYSQVLKLTVYFGKDVILAAKDFVRNALFEFPDDLPTDNAECIRMMDDHYKEQVLLGSTLNDRMRASLNLEKIDQSLFKRGE